MTRNGRFCSCCVLRSIVINIHQNMQNVCDLLHELSQASAVPIAEQVTMLSSTLKPGHQEDRSEFLILLLDHLTQYLSPTSQLSNDLYSNNPIRIMFGVTMKLSRKCTYCTNKINKTIYESIWSVSIISYLNLAQALHGFCSAEKLDDHNMIFCSSCQRQASAIKISHASTVIFIHIKRFIYDQQDKLIRKIKQSISYPELLDLERFMDLEMVETNKVYYEATEFIYKLFAFVVHIGEFVDKGHIFSYVRAPDDCWYKADDESVTSTTLNNIFCDKDCYKLCYIKLSENESTQYEMKLEITLRPSIQSCFSSTPIRNDNRFHKQLEDYETVREILILIMFLLLYV